MKSRFGAGASRRAGRPCSVILIVSKLDPMKLAHFLLAFKSVNPLLVGFGDLRKAIDELEGFGEPAGGLFLQVTV